MIINAVKLKLLLIFIPGFSWASGTTGGYLLLGILLSIPSFIAIGILYLFIDNQSEQKELKIMKVNLICIMVLLPCGICFPSYGSLVPNWVAFKSGAYFAPIISSILINIFLMIIYKKKWKINNKKVKAEVVQENEKS